MAQTSSQGNVHAAELNGSLSNGAPTQFTRINRGTDSNGKDLYEYVCSFTAPASGVSNNNTIFFGDTSVNTMNGNYVPFTSLGGTGYDAMFINRECFTNFPAGGSS